MGKQKVIALVDCDSFFVSCAACGGAACEAAADCGRTKKKS